MKQGKFLIQLCTIVYHLIINATSLVTLILLKFLIQLCTIVYRLIINVTSLVTLILLNLFKETGIMKQGKFLIQLCIIVYRLIINATSLVTLILLNLFKRDRNHETREVFNTALHHCLSSYN